MASALCAFHLAVLSCAKAPPAVATRPASPIERLNQDILAATRSSGVERAAWGILVRSLDRDETLASLNPGTLLVPASVAKLVTLATAVEAVGWDYRFETTLLGTGPLVDGTLQGDLLLVGSGDPSPGGREGDDLSLWVEALKRKGITKIDGRVIGDDDAFEDPRPGLAWAWDDLGYSTGALFGALNLDENRMLVTIEPGALEGTPATLSVESHAESRPLANRTTTGPAGSNGLVWPEQRPGDPSLTIVGSIPLDAGPARLAVAVGNPTRWFASVFRTRLLESGMAVSGEAVDVDEVVPVPRRNAATLYVHQSHRLAELARPLFKNSINLYGEAVFRLNAAAAPRTNDAAIDGMRRTLDRWGIPRDSYQIVDGSGLSRRDAISSEALVAVLQRMYGRDDTAPWMSALPIAGEDGTLADRMKGTAAAGNLRAKTGTMTNIRSLAGYVRTADGEVLAFAILVNNFDGTGAQAVAAIDRIAVRLAAFSRRN